MKTCGFLDPQVFSRKLYILQAPSQYFWVVFWKNLGRFYGIIVLGKNFGEIFVCRRKLGKEVFVIGKIWELEKNQFLFRKVNHLFNSSGAP